MVWRPPTAATRVLDAGGRRSQRRIRLALLAFASSISLASLPSATLAQPSPTAVATPPMGWDSARAFGCSVTEDLVRAAADALHRNGMSRVGYQYVVVGDCWQGARDREGFIQPDARRFPSGMKALADYVHARGLKFGLSSAPGNVTCSGGLGSRGHEYQDALQYARWGVDYLSYRWCDGEDLEPKSAVTTMRDALRATKRPITLALSGTHGPEDWRWASSVGHTWRATVDVATCFACVESRGNGTAGGVLPTVDAHAPLRAYAGVGHWSDLGALVSDSEMTTDEMRAHVSLWSMLAAPLFVSRNLGSLPDSTRSILTNPEVVAMDQDILGIPGFRYRQDGELEVWVRPLSRGKLAVLFLNRGSTPLAVRFDWTKQRVNDDLTHKRYDFGNTVYTVRDMWEHTQLGTTEAPLSTTLQSHSVTLLRLTPHK